jgi:polysaccharide deacetylase 2 family uncharacterized protein YibQ
MAFSLPRPQWDLTPRQHLVLGLTITALLIATAVTGVQMFGDPKAASPRAVVSLATGGEEAPRVTVTENAVDPGMLAGEEMSAPSGLSEPGSALDAADPLSDDSIAESAQRKAKPLTRAPIAALHAQGPNGQLPIIASDGRTVAKAYARPFEGDQSKARIALIVGGLGFNARTTQAAIDELPADVTLSFMPYATDLQGWIDRARADGHEVMLELPMEPFDREGVDTGPDTLMAALSGKENVERLERVLARGAGYFGVTNYQGARFVNSTAASAPIARALKERGLTFLGNGVGARTGLGVEAGRAGLSFTPVDRIIDGRREAEAIDEQLLHLEALALQNGSALGSGFAFPVTIDQIKSWAENLSMRGYQLAPASSVMESRTARR